MLFNYLEAFPLPVHVILPRLKDLLIPLRLSTKKRIEIDCMQESVSDDELNECLHLQIISVSGEKVIQLKYCLRVELALSNT